MCLFFFLGYMAQWFSYLPLTALCWVALTATFHLLFSSHLLIYCDNPLHGISFFIQVTPEMIVMREREYWVMACVATS